MSKYFAILLITAPICFVSPSNAEKTKLIFNLDSGFGNGIVVQYDRLATTRICHALKPLQKYYDVYLILNPMVADKSKLFGIIDIVVGHDIPFILDVFSSDTHMLGSVTPQNAPYDPLHGISISVEELARFKTKYGKMLAGLRFHEVTAQDFTVRAMKTTNPEWKPPKLTLPDDNYFDPEKVEKYVRFASENEMFVQWSDWHWSKFAKWDTENQEREKHLLNILKKYPNIVTVTYANNEPGICPKDRLGNWWTAIEEFAKFGSNGYGLSNQSWLAGDMKCPIEYIIEWTQSALNRRCRMIQFESIWYFFNLPFGTFEIGEYKHMPEWKHRGTPRESFDKLNETLLNYATRKQKALCMCNYHVSTTPQ